jgi:hypothetical protein
MKHLIACKVEWLLIVLLCPVAGLGEEYCWWVMTCSEAKAPSGETLQQPQQKQQQVFLTPLALVL